MPENPCRRCIHYKDCPNRTLCNSFISREDAWQSSVNEARCARDYREYREAYYEYAADDSCD
jgi:hypothetical protein